ncbi:TIGR02206 family membrane protein [Planococcus sp. ISL-109]|uniref:YwaF family protein n=1 Tax=Planococcus sp. ISL-109 TaxID=2819166 RepID=UPI001BE84C9B|nr:TIGR02206 family membrane protein [Planococcus sp. ISL-109]MBT2583189.1 TIGR02206 family membrane protein [Planococcus sp. ISL-109]
METWFDARSDYPFELFSFSHLVVLSIAFIGLLCIVLLKDRLGVNAQLFQWLRWLLLAILFVSEVSYQYWAVSHGFWSFSRHAPLHLCGVASLTAMIGLLTLRPFWIQVSFFIGIFPAILALVTPETPYDYQHFQFWVFFVQHTAISWACLLLGVTFFNTINIRSVFSIYALLLVYAAFIGFLVNPLMGSNYLYLAQRPSTASPLDFFGDGVWYYINLCLAALLLFLVQYLIFHWFIKKRHRERNNSK